MVVSTQLYDSHKTNSDLQKIKSMLYHHARQLVVAMVKGTKMITRSESVISDMLQKKLVLWSQDQYTDQNRYTTEIKNGQPNTGFPSELAIEVLHFLW